MTSSAVRDAADALLPEEQETLINILRRRVAESGRNLKTEDVQETRREFDQGQCAEARFDKSRTICHHTRSPNGKNAAYQCAARILAPSDLKKNLPNAG